MTWQGWRRVSALHVQPKQGPASPTADQEGRPEGYPHQRGAGPSCGSIMGQWVLSGHAKA